jgi:hypothetical protein
MTPAELAALRKTMGLKPAADPSAPWSANESAHQRNLMTWCDHAKATMPELAWLYASANGGLRTAATAGRMKGEGVKAGVFDLSLDCARHGFHGLRIELKVPAVPGIKGVCKAKPAGKPSPEQLAWQKNYLAEGYQAVICYGWLEAKSTLEWYLS